MQDERPYVISIAGFDPSAGAGILSDIKTFEGFAVYGLGVCSAVTIQNEVVFRKVDWISAHSIIEQVDVLLEKYPVSFIKIGLIENLPVLEEVILHIHSKFPAVSFVWDPVLSATAGFTFHSHMKKQQLLSIAKHVLVVTPNAVEIRLMMKDNDALDAAMELAKSTSVFVKSYIKPDRSAGDLLLTKGEEIFFRRRENIPYRKHGSGCVLSAAITALVAKGHDLKSACAIAQDYVLQFLKSSEGLLGYHTNMKLSVANA